MKFSLKHLIKWGYDAGALLLFYQIAEAENAYADFVEMFGADEVGLLTSERETENYKDKNILIITQQRFCSKLVSNKNEEKKQQIIKYLQIFCYGSCCLPSLRL